MKKIMFSLSSIIIATSVSTSFTMEKSQFKNTNSNNSISKAKDIPLYLDGLFPDPTVNKTIRKEVSQFIIDDQYIMWSDAEKVTTLSFYNLNVDNIYNIYIFPNLNVLKINHSKMSDWSEISVLTKLSYLELQDDNLSSKDLHFLKHVCQLRSLILNNNQINDLTPISCLNHLKYLNVSDTQVVNLNPLTQLQHLEWLNLSNNNIKDITAIKQLDNLTNLSLNNNHIDNILELKNLTNLKFLNLDSNNIWNLNPLSNLLNLNYLSLWYNSVSNNDAAWSPIHNLPNNPSGDDAWDNQSVRNSQNQF